MRILPLLTLTISVAGIAIAPNLFAQENQLPTNNTSFTGGVPTLVSADAPNNDVNYLKYPIKLVAIFNLVANQTREPWGF